MPIDLSQLPRNKIRILVCNICQSIQEFPHFDGNPDEDILLHGLLGRHGHRVMSLGGDRPDMRIMTVDEKMWGKTEYRHAIIKRIREEEGHTGLGNEYYASHNTYREEAMRCFNAHRRPKGTCIDWEDKSKLLGNTLQEDDDLRELSDDERRTLRDTRKRVYLCHFCPVASMVAQKQRYAAGMYNK